MPQLCTSLEFGECTTQEPRAAFLAPSTEAIAVGGRHAALPSLRCLTQVRNVFSLSES